MTDEKEYFPPTSVRFSKEERARLDAEAGSLSVSSYIRHRLFETPTPRRAYRRPVQDDKALGQVLAALGQSRIGNNLNQLAKAVHSGSLPVTPETEAAILAACASVQQMNGQLVKALGLPEEGKADPPEGGGE
ncbi:MAG: plasmid mobilization relaxosome protein MobC [Alphaproteobacteria bacterium]|nr:plasmid mobilization relaxosome protein MobC [Alphaproteobacteria bacterium]